MFAAGIRFNFAPLWVTRDREEDCYSHQDEALIVCCCTNRASACNYVSRVGRAVTLSLCCERSKVQISRWLNWSQCCQRLATAATFFWKELCCPDVVVLHIYPPDLICFALPCTQIDIKLVHSVFVKLKKKKIRPNWSLNIIDARSTF